MRSQRVPGVATIPLVAIGLGAAIAAATLLPSEARAATGALTAVECISSSSTTACAHDPALGEPFSVEVSPDGRDVYVASSTGVFQYRRDGETGSLTHQACIGSQASACGTVGLPGLVDQLSVSADGRSVYAISDTSLIHLARDPVSGTLTFKGCIAGNLAAPDECSQRSKNLGFPDDVATSPDGRSVYVTSSADGNYNDPGDLVVFRRNKRNGNLRQAQCYSDVDLRPCGPQVRAFYDPGGMSLSPDGKSVYVTSLNDHAVHTFQRRRSTGRLAYRGCLCAKRLSKFGWPFVTVVSPDARSVYVQSTFAVLSLRRDRKSGQLRFQDCVESAPAPSDVACSVAAPYGNAHFHGALAVSPDGAHVYAASEHEIGIFNRLPSGGLAPAGCVADVPPLADCATSSEGLDRAWWLAVSPDGRNLYAASEPDQAVVVLARS